MHINWVSANIILFVELRLYILELQKDTSLSGVVGVTDNLEVCDTSQRNSAENININWKLRKSHLPEKGSNVGAQYGGHHVVIVLLRVIIREDNIEVD